MFSLKSPLKISLKTYSYIICSILNCQLQKYFHEKWFCPSNALSAPALHLHRQSQYKPHTLLFPACALQEDLYSHTHSIKAAAGTLKNDSTSCPHHCTGYLPHPDSDISVFLRFSDINYTHPLLKTNILDISWINGIKCHISPFITRNRLQCDL